MAHNRIFRCATLALFAAAAAGLIACAPEVRRRPVELVPAVTDESAQVVTVLNEVTVTPSIGYPRTIAAGSQWRRVGRIGEGAVFRPVAGVFTVEGAHVHEAALVISDERITGFYMLVERAFVVLDPAVVVQLKTGGVQ